MIFSEGKVLQTISKRYPNTERIHSTQYKYNAKENVLESFLSVMGMPDPSNEVTDSVRHSSNRGSIALRAFDEKFLKFSYTHFTAGMKYRELKKVKKVIKEYKKYWG